MKKNINRKEPITSPCAFYLRLCSAWCMASSSMKNENLYLEIINNLSDGVYFVDTERRITFWNKAAEEITGYKQEEILGKCCQSNLLNHIDKSGQPLCLVGCPLYASMIDGHQRRDEVFLRHKSGHRIPILVSIFPITEDGKIVGAIEIFTVKSPIEYEDDLIERLSNLAMNDPLTGVSNRRKLQSYLEYRLHERKRFHNKFCITFMDIDNFGHFNELYGRETGDEVLMSVTKSIMHITRKDDLFGRWGNAEFLGIFEIKNDYEAALIAEKLRILVSKSEIPHEDAKLAVTASLGVTLARDDDTVESAVKRADSLMRQSKQKNKNCVTSDA